MDQKWCSAEQPRARHGMAWHRPVLLFLPLCNRYPPLKPGPAVSPLCPITARPPPAPHQQPAAPPYGLVLLLSRLCSDHLTDLAGPLLSSPFEPRPDQQAVNSLVHDFLASHFPFTLSFVLLSCSLVRRIFELLQHNTSKWPLTTMTKPCPRRLRATSSPSPSRA